MNNTSIKTQILMSLLFAEAIFIGLYFLGFEESFWFALFDIGFGIGLAYILSSMIASSVESLTKKTIQFGNNEDVSFAGYQGSTEVCELSAGLEEMRKQIVSKNKLIAAQLDKIDEYIVTSTTDANGKIVDVSNAYCMICGYTKEELIGNAHNTVRHPDNPKDFFKKLWEQISKGQTWQGEIKNRAKDGQTYWIDATITPLKDDNDKVIGFYSISHDITAKKIAEELALTDSLTGLDNRRKLDSDFDELSKLFGRYQNSFSVVIADIDKFKAVNDAFGHEIGDTVLQKFARILKSHTRATDKVGRWGGEEFMIICPNTDTEDAIALAQKLRMEISDNKFAVVGKVTASFGVSTFVSGDTPASCAKRADDALYIAKDRGRNRVEYVLGTPD